MTAPPKAELDARLQGDLVTIRAGSDLVLDAAVGGKPEPKIIWTKGDKELDLCEKNIFAVYWQTSNCCDQVL